MGWVSLAGHHAPVIQRLSAATLVKGHSTVVSRSRHANDDMTRDTSGTFFLWNFVTGLANHVIRRANDLISVQPGPLLFGFSFISRFLLSPTMSQVLNLRYTKVRERPSQFPL